MLVFFSNQGNANKTTLRNLLTPVRMAKTNRASSSTSWRGGWERESPSSCWWDCKLAQPLWKPWQKIFKKIQVSPPYAQLYYALAYAQSSQHPTLKTSAQSIARTCQQPKCPSNDEWMVNKWYICSVGFYSALKKRETMTVQVSEQNYKDHFE